MVPLNDELHENDALHAETCIKNMVIITAPIAVLRSDHSSAVLKSPGDGCILKSWWVAVLGVGVFVLGEGWQLPIWSLI